MVKMLVSSYLPKQKCIHKVISSFSQDLIVPVQEKKSKYSLDFLSPRDRTIGMNGILRLHMISWGIVMTGFLMRIAVDSEEKTKTVLQRLEVIFISLHSYHYIFKEPLLAFLMLKFLYILHICLCRQWIELLLTWILQSTFTTLAAAKSTSVSAYSNRLKPPSKRTISKCCCCCLLLLLMFVVIVKQMAVRQEPQ